VADALTTVSPVADVKATGATVVNVHHANAINPWINHPSSPIAR
jgi:hypothetical protein